MPWPEVATLTRPEIAEIFERVWGTREHKLADEATPHNVDSLCVTVSEIQAEVESVVSDLPPRAFARQPDDIDGSDVWSAGQIIAHLADMELMAIPFWEAVGKTGRLQPPAALLEAANRPSTNADDCLRVAAAIREHGNELLPRVAAICSGEEQAVHMALGQVDVRTALLGSCLHLFDHWQQLESLGTNSAEDARS